MCEDIVSQLKFNIECERRNGLPEDCGLMEALVGAVTEIERLRKVEDACGSYVLGLWRRDSE